MFIPEQAWPTVVFQTLIVLVPLAIIIQTLQCFVVVVLVIHEISS